ncbi:MAG TPA: rhodanese-like domain-containing protein [Acidimicrobiales bacterium]|nr:rhodanese-like domain-containing protein [Acidimicrobiales bacterium]
MEVPEIDIDELARLRESGVVLVDVRQPHEFERFRVPGATLIPLGDVPERVEEIPDDQRVYVICASGGRSAKAVEYLNRQGYDTVNVAGGSKAWLDAGLPVEHGPA